MNILYRLFLGTLLLFLSQNIFSQKTPTIFAKDVIPSGAMEFNASFTSDGKQIYFSIASANWSRISICRATFVDGAWQTPELLPFSGKYLDADPFLFKDNRLYFISDRPISGNDAEYQKWDYHIWFVDRKGDAWGDPQLLEGPFSDVGTMLYPSFSTNRNLYFSANAQIYVSKYVGGEYQQPVKLDFVKEELRYIDAVVSKDERFLIFSSKLDGSGQGKGDLWISFNKDGKWQEPENLGSTINSPMGDGQPALSPDQTTLFYCYGGNDLEEKVFSSYDELRNRLSGAQNGLLDIYHVEIPERFLKKAGR